MKTKYVVMTVMVVLSLLASGAATIRSASERSQNELQLSSYWSHKVQRWSDLIIQEAERRALDPDFLASLVWMESRGDANAVGPAGAVGLMQVMPKEAGFSWRPEKAALLDPSTNLFWGARTLATVIEQGDGDVFNALAAYNGGWDQTMYRGPKHFATTILRDYAHAVALRYGQEGRWIAFFAVRAVGIHGPIWVADSGRDDVYFYNRANWVPDGMPLIPDVPPSSVLARYTDKETAACYDVGVWLYDVTSGEWLIPDNVYVATAARTSAALNKTMSPPEMEVSGSASTSRALPDATPIPTKTPAPPPTSEAVVAAPSDPPADPVSAPPSESAEAPETEQAEAETAAAPPCAGGDFWGEAWYYERQNTPEGWKATIYATGHGGDCQYTYAWKTEEDVRGGPVAGPLTFEVASPHRNGSIIGSVLITSGDETISVGIYIPSPE
ncbi:MAG: lytic transglycosylase domain-containing protein [Anaerolineales bacterium]